MDLETLRISTSKMGFLRVVALGLIVPVLAGCGYNFSPAGFSDVSFDFNTADSPTLITTSTEPVFSEEPVFEQIPGTTGHHAATMTVLPDGELLASWYSYPGQHELAGSAIYMARKPAGATAWESPRLHVDRPQGDGNPVLYSEGDHVWLFQAVVPFGWDTSHIEFQESSDRGATWTDPVVLAGGLGPNTKYPPIRLADGTLLFPAYNELLARSVFFASTDGTHWEQRSSVASDPGNIQPSLVQLQNGRLLCVMRNQKKGWQWITASDDNGQTWLAPADSGFPNPASAGQLLRLQNGHLLLVYNDSRTERRPLSVALSADEGRTWPYKRVLKDGPDTYSYPFAVQAPNGLIHVLYSLNRERINHVTVNESWLIAGK